MSSVMPTTEFANMPLNTQLSKRTTKQLFLLKVQRSLQPWYQDHLRRMRQPKNRLSLLGLPQEILDNIIDNIQELPLDDNPHPSRDPSEAKMPYCMVPMLRLSQTCTLFRNPDSMNTRDYWFSWTFFTYGQASSIATKRFMVHHSSPNGLKVILPRDYYPGIQRMTLDKNSWYCLTKAWVKIKREGLNFEGRFRITGFALPEFDTRGKKICGRQLETWADLTAVAAFDGVKLLTLKLTALEVVGWLSTSDLGGAGRAQETGSGLSFPCPDVLKRWARRIVDFFPALEVFRGIERKDQLVGHEKTLMANLEQDTAWVRDPPVAGTVGLWDIGSIPQGERRKAVMDRIEKHDQDVLMALNAAFAARNSETRGQ